MNTINDTNFGSYRNAELVQFAKNVLAVMDKTPIPTLTNRVADLRSATQTMETVLQPATGNELTPELTALDDRRDRALMGIKAYLESQLYREEPERVKAAESLKANYLSHGDRIDKLSYQQETAVVDALLKDWKQPNLQAALTTLDLQDWVNLLAAQNQAFDELYVQRAGTSTDPANSAAKRADFKAAYIELTSDLVAYTRLADDKAPYLATIATINGLIDNYNLSIKQRLSSNTAAAKKTPPQS